MITFTPTRNIDLIENGRQNPDIIAGSNNGDGYDYKPECRYFEVNVHQFGGIVYYNEIQPLTLTATPCTRLRFVDSVRKSG